MVMGRRSQSGLSNLHVNNANNDSLSNDNNACPQCHCRTCDGSRPQSSASAQAQRFTGAEYQGSGAFVSSAAPLAGVADKATGTYQLNLLDAPIAAAAKAVLDDILNVNYILDPRVQGTVTLQTSSPVSAKTLVTIFESTLAANSAGIVERGGAYRIVPLSETLAGTPPVSVPSMSPSGPGIKVQVIQLQYIAADEMKKPSLRRVNTERIRAPN